VFSHAVRDLMQHLSASPSHFAPFVQLTSLRDLGRHVRHSVTQEHAWSDVLREHLQHSPELLLFVKPVETAADVISGASHPCGQTPCSQLPDVEPPVTGRLGDCCDGSDDEEEEVGELLNDAATTSTRLKVSYFGVVAQSRSRAASDGCYLIKTVRHVDDPSCTCMHYSLMHVCQGVPLSEQVLNHWC
jgi:hypothetical protein